MVWGGRDWSRGLTSLHSIVPCQTADFLCKSSHEFCCEATLTPARSSVLLYSSWGSCIGREAVASGESICTAGWCVLLPEDAGLGICEDVFPLSSTSFCLPAGQIWEQQLFQTSFPKPSPQQFWLIQPPAVHGPAEFGVDGEREDWLLWSEVCDFSIAFSCSRASLFSHGWEDPVQNQSRTQTTVLDFWV